MDHKPRLVRNTSLGQYWFEVNESAIPIYRQKNKKERGMNKLINLVSGGV
jgi:hypothetical protein